MTRGAEQLGFAFEAPAPQSAIAAARELEAPPEGVEFITDAELEEIFGPAASPREEASADACTGVEGAEP